MIRSERLGLEPGSPMIDWSAVESFRRQDCSRCGGTGWWAESGPVGRDGWQLIGGPCDHDPRGRGSHD